MHTLYVKGGLSLNALTFSNWGMTGLHSMLCGDYQQVQQLHR